MTDDNKQISINLVKSYGIGASIIGIIQSTIWFVLCVLGIFYYSGIIDKVEIDDHYIDGYLYYLFFFDDNDETVSIRGHDFMIIMSFYLVISLAWFAISVYLCTVVFQNKWHQSKYSVIPWTIVTSIIVISDVIVVILLGIDLNKIASLNNGYLDISYYTMIFVSGRGFVLWTVNIIYVILFANIIIKDYGNKTVDVLDRDRDASHIQAFNENNFDKDEQSSAAFERNGLNDVNHVDERRVSYSNDFLKKLDTILNNVKNLPRIPYVMHRDLRPTTPPIDYSPYATVADRRHKQNARREYEPLKF